MSTHEIDVEEAEVATDFIFIAVHKNVALAIRKPVLLGRRTVSNLVKILKYRDFTLTTKVHIVKDIAFFPCCNIWL